MKTIEKPIRLEWFDGDRWVHAGSFWSEALAWMSLGNDAKNYRTIDENGRVLTDTRTKPIK